MRSLERVNIRTNVRTYVLTYIRTGQTLYPLHNFVVRGDNKYCFMALDMMDSKVELWHAFHNHPHGHMLCF